MANSVDLSRDWNKVLSGLHSAQIPYDGITFLTNAFDEMPPARAAAILAQGHFGDSNDENRDARNLFRALNFLESVGAESPASIDLQLRDAFRHGGALLPELQRRVKEAYVRIAPRPASTQLPVPHNAIVITNGAAPAVQNTTATQLVAAPSVNPALVAHSQLRRHFENNAAVASAWARARQDILDAVSQKRAWLLFNFTDLQTAINSAFQNFNGTLAGDSKAAKDRQDLVKSLLCGALKLAPPPLSAVGKLLGAAVDARKADNYDPTTKYSALKGPDTPFFIKHMAGVMEEIERNRTAIDLSRIGQQADFTTIASSASAMLLAVMETATQRALERVFGDRQTSQALLEQAADRYLGRVAATAALSRRTDFDKNTATVTLHPQLAEREFTGPFLQKFVHDTETQIKRAFSVARPQAGQQENLRIAIEMLLYSQYAVTIFHKQSDALRPVGDAMVNFFAQQGPWGVLMLHTDDHAASAAQHRLNWKGGDNHKKTLVLFCAWYLANINPFQLITGAQCNGKPYSAALIQQMCREHIDLINLSIQAGRKVNWAGWSSWDWECIYDAYRTNCEHPHWDDDTF